MDIYATLEKTLYGLGYELVEHELTPQGDFRVFIDKEGGVCVDDCVLVSNHLNRLLAVEDFDYRRLEISSPGLDRPLKKLSDFQRFAGSLAKVKTRLPIEGQKNFVGRLCGVEGNIILLKKEEKVLSRRLKRPTVVEGVTVKIALNNIDKARLKPEFD